MHFAQVCSYYASPSILLVAFVFLLYIPIILMANQHILMHILKCFLTHFFNIRRLVCSLPSRNRNRTTRECTSGIIITCYNLLNCDHMVKHMYTCSIKHYILSPKSNAISENIKTVTSLIIKV